MTFHFGTHVNGCSDIRHGSASSTDKDRMLRGLGKLRNLAFSKSNKILMSCMELWAKQTASSKSIILSSPSLVKAIFEGLHTNMHTLMSLCATLTDFKYLKPSTNSKSTQSMKLFYLDFKSMFLIPSRLPFLQGSKSKYIESSFVMIYLMNFSMPWDCGISYICGSGFVR